MNRKKWIIVFIYASINIIYYTFKDKNSTPSQKISSPPPPLVPAHRKTATDEAPSSPAVSSQKAIYQKVRHELSRFHHPDTHISIEKREVLSPRQHRVLITYTLPDGRRNSFQAILDTEKQTLSRRWGRTIHEGRDPLPKKLYPSGHL